MGDGHGPSEGSIAKQLERSPSSSARAWCAISGCQTHGRADRRGAPHRQNRLRAEYVQCGPSRRRCPGRRTGPRGNRLCAVLSARRLHAAAVVDPVQRRPRLGATPMQVALAWLLRRAPNILLIPGTSSVAHLRENLTMVDLPDDAIAALNRIAAEGAASKGGRAGRLRHRGRNPFGTSIERKLHRVVRLLRTLIVNDVPGRSWRRHSSTRFPGWALPGSCPVPSSRHRSCREPGR